MHKANPAISAYRTVFPRRTSGHGSAVVISVLVALAQAVPALAASPVAFVNVTDSEKTFPVGQTGPAPITSLSLDASQPSNVLVQFSGGVTVETSEGCPCSVRAFLKVDGEPMLPVKRINLGSPAVQDVAKYEHDRQEITGSLVFPVDAGSHKFSLIVQQVTGDSKKITVVYPNMQAIAFPR